MPLNPSKSLHFDSWESLLQWLPEASEAQLMTVFVWAGDLQSPTSDGIRLAQVRRESFERLVGRSRERLKHFLEQRVHCRDPYLAEDVVQQVLIKLYLRAEQFDPRRSFWGWLYRIARNEYIDALRRQRPGDIGLGGWSNGDESEQWLEQLTNAKTDAPDADILERERRAQFENALATLPPLQRTIVRLKREGCKGREIALQLKISQAYVSQLFHEAGEYLRDALDP
jgi:RNA polymerase sigma factor (sigma-70 family)